jgi:hypothetical protein
MATITAVKSFIVQAPGFKPSNFGPKIIVLPTLLLLLTNPDYFLISTIIPQVMAIAALEPSGIKSLANLIYQLY